MMRRIKDFFLQNTSPRQTVLKNTFWLFAGEVTGRILRFSIVIYSARVLGAAEYGIFSYALTIAAFVTIFSDIGISALITRETSKNPELRERYIGTSLALKGILIGLNVLLVLFGVPLFASVPGALPLLPLVVLIFAFDSLREFGFGVNRALEHMEREAFVKILMNAAIAGLGFWALYLAPTAHSLAMSYAIGSGIGCILTAWLLRAYVLTTRRGIDWKLMWPLFKMAWPVGMLGLLGAIMINTDMVMLGWWVSTTDLGYYAAAQKIILLLYVAPTLFASAAFPAFARLAGSANERFRAVFEESLAAIQALALPVCVGGIIIAPRLVALLFGAEYLPATRSVEILLLTILIVFPSALLSNALFAFNEQRRFLAYLALGAGSNALFNWLLIPQFGIEGASFATLASQILTNGFVWMRMRRILNFSILGRLGNVVVATIMLGIAVYASDWFELSTIVTILIGIAVYAGSLVLLREPLLRIRSILRA